MRLLGADVGEIEPDEFSDWLIRRGICPHSVISVNSRYHFENLILLDGEMGLTLPDPSKSIGDTPSIFWQALNLVRGAKAKVREEEKQNAAHNSN